MLHFIKPYFYRKFKTSFSKSGEDIQLWQLLKNKRNGTYVDVGGHHPIFGNNSYFFYLRGWRGIVVEPNPIFKPIYKKFRPNDYLVSEGVAEFDGLLEYFEFESNLINTFSKNYISENNLGDSVVNKWRIPVKKLSTLIEQSNLKSLQIDFLSIDVEGLELDVLKGNEWNKYRPKYILLESHKTLSEDIDSEISKFLDYMEYELIGKSMLAKQIGTLWYKCKTDSL